MVVEVAFLLLFVHELALQLLPHDFMQALLHFAFFDVEAVCCCCPKAKPVIPTIAIAKKSFFMIFSDFKIKT